LLILDEWGPDPQGRRTKPQRSSSEKQPDTSDRFSAWKTKPWIAVD
jgi:hypothetical protein